MRISKSTSLLLSAAVAVAVAAPAAAGGPHPAPGSQSDTVTHICDDHGDEDPSNDDTITLDGPTLLWPPNHKLVDVPLIMEDGDDGENAPVSFVTTSSHNEMTEEGEMNGSGNTDVDTIDADASGDMGRAEGEIQVRAERSGRGDGRVYTINVNGTAGDDECSTTFYVNVPHDMRPSNRVKPDNTQD